MDIQQLTLDQALTQLNECAHARRELLKENIILRKENADLKGMLEDMGQQLQAAQHQQADFTWHKRMDSVSFKRCSTPEKQILSALRDVQIAVPRTDKGDFQIHVKQVMTATGMCKNTVLKHMDTLETKGLLTRRYEGNGKSGQQHRDSLFVKVDDRVINNPNNIHRLVPVDRTEARGGLRVKKEPEELFCPNCASPHTRGHRHETGICDDCGHSFDEWTEFPKEPEEVPAPAPIVSITPETYIQADFTTVQPVTPQPPEWRKARPCAACGGREWVFSGMSEWEGEESTPLFECVSCAQKAVTA